MAAVAKAIEVKYAAAIIAVILAAHAIGSAVNSMLPEDAINESMYVEINGTEQWIKYFHTAHGLLESKSEYFSEILHQIADTENKLTALFSEKVL